MKGTYAEFSGVEGLELATKSLENRQTGIRLLNVQTINGIMKATVFIPEGKEEFFIKRMDAYASETTKKGNPKNQDLIGSIENIKLAMVDSFWTDKLETLPTDTAINCEIWLRYEIKKTDFETWNSVEEEFHNICDELKITVDKGKRICASDEHSEGMVKQSSFPGRLQREDAATLLRRNSDGRRRRGGQGLQFPV